ncbi:MAG: type II toxin-antitoxin system HicB family antitoxin [Chloroflexota bacterium]|nr:type II toxin-antitoxin system HicB family antitoxin [Chloroflexota bacterium]
MKDYHVNIFWSDEDGAYVADIPDLRYCSALGATPRQALEELEAARDLWLEVARAEGRPIPLPTYRPMIYQVAG